MLLVSQRPSCTSVVATSWKGSPQTEDPCQSLHPCPSSARCRNVPEAYKLLLTQFAPKLLWSLSISPIWPAEDNWFWPVFKSGKARGRIFPATTLQVPALWLAGAEELRGSLIHEQGHSGQNQFCELVRSI